MPQEPTARELAAGAVEFVYRLCLCSQCRRRCALEPLRYGQLS